MIYVKNRVSFVALFGLVFLFLLGSFSGACGRKPPSSERQRDAGEFSISLVDGASKDAGSVSDVTKSDKKVQEKASQPEPQQDLKSKDESSPLPDKVKEKIVEKEKPPLPDKNKKEAIVEPIPEKVFEPKKEAVAEPIPEKKAQDKKPRSFHPYYDLDPKKGQVGLSNASILKIHNGNFIANKDGQVVENLHIKGSVYIQANRVTIRNCKIELGSRRVSAISLRARNGKTLNGLLVTRSEIKGGLVGVSLATAKLQTHGGANGNRIEFVYMHGIGDGVLGNNFTLYRSRIETVKGPWGKNHSDGIQVFQQGYIKLIDSYIDAGVDARKAGVINAAVFIGQDYLPNIQEVHIQRCYLNGGGHIYRHWKAKANLKEVRPTKCSVVNSWFGKDSIWDSAVAYTGKDGSPVWKGNRYLSNSKPVPLTRR